MTERWPELKWEAWRETAETLQLWMQIVGKTQLAATPREQHWWNATFHVTARGLATPLLAHGDGFFEMEFDFLRHVLEVRRSDGRAGSVGLRPRTVKDFLASFRACLRELGIAIEIWTTPVELPEPIPFEQDEAHASYDREYAARFAQVLQRSAAVFHRWQGPWLGKASPVHFFWGSMDLAVTRFSGRRAPERVGADVIQREAYSHEVISAGFWAGGGYGEAAFYCYAAPVPEGMSEGKVAPGAAFWEPKLGEFLLRYEDVRRAEDPEGTLLEFLESGYGVAAGLAGWDREELER